ncbi:MAG: class I SAM-dependent methyltransferase [Candidatus Tectomicrobia bacterium]|nr:class I SAM-dependent methyltransferase [Candidatus Tectomicrobia bacterium]
MSSHPADAARRNLESFTRRAGCFTERTKGDNIPPLRHAAEAIGFGPGQWAADFGVGTGNSAVPFLQAGGSVIGIDITPAMARSGRKRLAEEGLARGAHFVLALCEGAPLAEGAVDCAVCRNVFHHLAAPREVLREMARVVRPGGHVILMDHLYPDGEAERARMEEIDHAREPAMVRILSLKDMRALFAECGLEVTGSETMSRRDTFENWLHGAGTAAESVPLVRAGVERLRGEGGSWMAPEGEGAVLTVLRWDALVVGRRG